MAVGHTVTSTAQAAAVEELAAHDLGPAQIPSWYQEQEYSRGSVGNGRQGGFECYCNGKGNQKLAMVDVWRDVEQVAHSAGQCRNVGRELPLP